MRDPETTDLAMDWPAEKIRAAIREKAASEAERARAQGFMVGRAINQRGLSMEAGFSDSNVRAAIIRPLPSGERVIAEFLGIPAHEIWPSRYFPDGSRRAASKSLRDPSATSGQPHRQNRRIA